MPEIIIEVAARDANAGRPMPRAAPPGDVSSILMSLDPTWLFLSMIPSGVGFVLFAYGKKQGRWVMTIAGVVFMVYPYFTQSIAAMLGVGVVLSVATWMAVNAGW
jgi:hypothetical protein